MEQYIIKGGNPLVGEVGKEGIDAKIKATSTVLFSLAHFHMDAPAPNTSSSGCATTKRYLILFQFFIFSLCIFIILQHILCHHTFICVLAIRAIDSS